METLNYRRVGYGSYIVTLEKDNKILTAHTNDSHVIDCAFDDNYDLYDNSGRFYETQEEARQSLINYILRDNE
jgi:hypothetical protein